MTNPFIRHEAQLPADLVAAVEGDDTAGEALTVSDLAAADWEGDGRARDRREPEDLTHNNTRFAGHALAALEAYTDRAGGIASEPSEQVMRDLLADLMHLADALGVRFDYLIGRAEQRYTEEITGDL